MTQLLSSSPNQETSEVIGRILVTDDNTAIHEDFDKILAPAEDRGDLSDMEMALFGESAPTHVTPKFELFHANQGQVAYEMVKEMKERGETLDMGFIDMRMPPGWDGVETVEKLWEVDPDLQIVICTAFSDYNWSDVLERLGTNDKLLLLKKPFERSEVTQLALALTKKRQAERVAKLNRASMEATIEQQVRQINQAQHDADRMLSAISSVVIGIDGNHRVTRWNETAENLFQIPPDLAVGAEFTSLSIDWNDREGADVTDLQDFKNEASESISITFKDHKNEIRHVQFAKFPLKNDGKCEGGLLLGTDMTEHKKLENQLQQAQKLESVGQLAAGVAHEMNTPLQYILNNLEYLQDTNTDVSKVISELSRLCQENAWGTEATAGLTDLVKETDLEELFEQRSGALEETLAGVEQVTRIVHAMKMFSHPGTTQTVKFDVNQALEMAITVSRNEWKFVAVMESDFATNLPDIEGYPTELNLVFLNLIVNASHALLNNKQGDVERSEPGQIKVKTEPNGDSVLVSISDTGCGIPEESCGRIFDPFYTTKEVGKGTGQGLALAHNVVTQKHGGRIWVESTVGEGTTFFVELPHEAPNAQEDPIARLEPAIPL